MKVRTRENLDGEKIEETANQCKKILRPVEAARSAFISGLLVVKMALIVISVDALSSRFRIIEQ